MKPNIHPEYHEIILQLTTGATVPTRSTYGKPGDVLKLEIDPEKHPAWTGTGIVANQNADKVASFNKRFSGFFGADAAPKEEPQN
ncbi:MAG: rpmE [Rickettsiales bacterium]|jgi:large subunit ribosomal protein L31|nr:rpmE [Rickettsiales bacterium]